MILIKSFNYSQEEIIRDILKLHNKNERIDLDPCYSKGIFYKNCVVEQPRLKFDLVPQTKDTVQASSNNLPLEDQSIKSIMFDPPFIIHGKTKPSERENSTRIFRRFGGHRNYAELKKHYYTSLKEFHRILEDKGILIFKLQNTVSSGKNHFTHYFVMKSALEIGFRPVDEFVLLNKSKITSFGGRWNNQVHAMKHHSYFMVFKKEKNKVDYCSRSLKTTEGEDAPPR